MIWHNRRLLARMFFFGPLLVLPWGCTKKVDGPTPQLEATRSVQKVCNALDDENSALRTRITLNAATPSFSPLRVKHLKEDATLQLPRVFVTLGESETELPDVRFVDEQQLHATISASSKLAPGKYATVVQNPNERRSEALSFLEVVAPPKIDSVELAERPASPLAVCSGKQTRFRLKGSGFRPDDAPPRVELLTCTDAKDPSTCNTPLGQLTQVNVESPTALVGSLQLAQPLPQDQVLALRVTNPEELPCKSTQIVAFETAASNIVFSAVVPRQGWTGVDTPIQVFGEGFATGMKLQLASLDATKPAIDLVDVRVDVSSTRIDAIVPEGVEAAANYQLVATGANGCQEVFDNAFTVLADPSLTIARVVSPFSWAQAKEPVSILGDGFASTPRAYLVIPSMSPRLQPLSSTSFVNGQSLGAIVKKDLPVGGPYDVVVINPDGGGGKLPGSFRVSASPPPTVHNATPAIGDTQTAPSVQITGCNFRAPFRVELVAPDQSTTATTLQGEPVCNGAATCPDGSALCTADLSIPTPSMTVNGYVVRAINEDENTWGDWSLFVVTLPSGKLTTWAKADTQLNVARSDLGLASGRVTRASRFLYAVGGQSDATGTALSSVEVVPIDAFGGVGAPFVQRYALNTARSEVSVVQRDGFLFAVGGRSDATTNLNSIERAKILTLEDQPQVSDPVLKAGSLLPGAWYYQVAAVYDQNKSDNPGGETLASDEVVVSLARAGGVQIAWQSVPDAVGYRVYRTAQPNGTSSSEVLLAELGGDELTFLDDGSRTPDLNQRPLAPGSTGVWVTQANSMNRARSGTSAHFASAPNGDVFLYAIGGKGDCGAGEGEMNCVEYAAFQGATHSLGAWAESGQTLTSPRYHHGFCAGYSSKDNQIPAGEHWLYASGGQNATNGFEATKVLDGGDLQAWQTLAPPQSAEPGQRSGHRMEMVANAMFVIGGVSGTSVAGAPLGSAQLSQSFDTGPTDRKNFSNSTAELTDPRSRYGFVLESGMFYAIGGMSGASGDQPLASIESIVY